MPNEAGGRDIQEGEEGDAPPVQSMEATGNASLRTDDYEGWAETIGLDDKVVRLTADKFGLARIKNRFGRGNDESGRIITYDRGTGAFSVIGSSGGSIAPKR